MTRVAILVGSLLLLVSGLCLLRLDWPPLNLIRFGAIPLCYTAGLIALGLLLVRQPVAAGLSGGGALLLLFGLWGYMTPLLPAERQDRPRTRVLFANMYFENKTPARLLPFIAAEAPDIVIMVESSPQERALFTPEVTAAYPYRFFYGETHVLSKYPFDDLGYQPIGHTVQGFLVHAPGGPLHIEVLHLSRPWPYANRSNPRYNPPDQIKAVLTRLETTRKDNLLVVGDFNATPNSSMIDTLCRRLDVRVVAAPTGTWPSYVPGLFRASFDNALFGRGLTITRRQVGPYVGSDHRPVVLDVQGR